MASRAIPCLVSRDGTCASVAGVRLDAAEVEALIWDLAACRAAMVPRRLPVMFDGSRIAVGTGWHVQRDGEGVMLAVMHPGAGWVGARATNVVCEALTAVAEPLLPEGRRSRRG
ncbi:hypothetical protein [Roseomonas sp. BN140053]|uniref:hypothetical protein n=1 Tax=Roseomonas sp. BN140053 TaxID=3391898 RepID=UPI0039EA6815